MARTIRIALAAALLSMTACGAPAGTDAGSPPTDAGSGPSDGGASDGATPPTDAGTSSDGGAPGVDGGPGPACAPTAGTATAGAYCDLFHLALIDDGTGAVEATLTGRLSPDGLAADGCATVDEIEVQEGGVAIGTMTGIGAYAQGSQSAVLARGPALPEMSARCGGDEGRFGGFGFVIRGRMDGGTYEARCADAEGGGRWPPALVVSCHENVDARPFGAYVSIDAGGGFTFTTLDVTMPHGPGGALTSIDGTIHVTSGAYGFGSAIAPDPFDASGFDASVYESSAPGPGTYSDLYLSTMGDPFGMDLCPVGWDGTGDPPDPPPVMLIRLTGTGERGAFSTEVYVDDCTRIPSGP